MNTALDFSFNNNTYKYFSHPHNKAGYNERAVEIPIIKDIIDKCGKNKTLEIGNVLSHYFKREWDVLDKYEKGDAIINEDIESFSPSEKYDLIVSISTFEHIGFDEGRYAGKKVKKNNIKFRSAIENVKSSCLNNGGLFVTTIPINYNPYINEDLFGSSDLFQKICFMKRTTELNEWSECSKEEVSLTEYGKPFPWSNGLAVCYYEKL